MEIFMVAVRENGLCSQNCRYGAQNTCNECRIGSTKSVYNLFFSVIQFNRLAEGGNSSVTPI